MNEPKVGLSSSVSAVCFIRDPNSSTRNEHHDQSHASSDNDDDDEEPLQFRCSEILLGKEAEITRRSGGNGAYRHDGLAASTSAAASAGLRGGLLASSHINGAALIWDLGTRRVVSQFADGSRGPGVALGLQRMGDDSSINRGSYRFFYHSRGADGIVSVHDVQPNGSLDAVVNYTTGCQTFCAASACTGSDGADGLNFLALPTKDECTAAVVDVRVDPTSQPAFLIHGAALAGDASGALSNEWRKHGMLTSLALCATPKTSGPILACGMESGSVYFHDLAMPGKSIETDFVGAIEQRKRPIFEQDISNDSISYSNPPHCSISLGKEPVLALDLTASSTNGSGDDSSKGAVIAVAGCAGDADELAGKPEDEQNTIGVIKATFDRSLDGDRSTMLRARIRSRIKTCEIGEDSARGKPGVGVCRFRPDGRIFAVGGWDKRLRLFSRSAGATPLALMRTHIDSVTAIDWAPDAAPSGILATGSEDGQIALWRAFPHTKREK